MGEEVCLRWRRYATGLGWRRLLQGLPNALRTMSLTARAALAVLLMIGFYAIALGIGAGLIAIPLGELVYLKRIDPRIAFFCLAGAFAILRSIVPRRDRFEAPGPTLTAKERPRLFAAISAVPS